MLLHKNFKKDSLELSIINIWSILRWDFFKLFQCYTFPGTQYTPYSKMLLRKKLEKRFRIKHYNIWPILRWDFFQIIPMLYFSRYAIYTIF